MYILGLHNLFAARIVTDRTYAMLHTLTCGIATYATSREAWTEFHRPALPPLVVCVSFPTAANALHAFGGGRTSGAPRGASAFNTISRFDPDTPRIAKRITAPGGTPRTQKLSEAKDSKFAFM